MYFPDIKQAGPVVKSEWETLGPRHIQYDPAEYVQRMYAWPSEHRGHNPVNHLPYNQKYVFPMYGTEENGHPLNQKMSLFLLLIGVGIIAYFLGKSVNSPKRNPYCWIPESRIRPRRRVSKSAKRARRRRAYMQPRDEYGRFVSTE
jgi:hypothetical protein